MKCHSCGTENFNQAIFCDVCGKKFGESSPDGAHGGNRSIHESVGQKQFEQGDDEEDNKRPIDKVSARAIEPSFNTDDEDTDKRPVVRKPPVPQEERREGIAAIPTMQGNMPVGTPSSARMPAVGVYLAQQPPVTPSAGMYPAQQQPPVTPGVGTYAGPQQHATRPALFAVFTRPLPHIILLTAVLVIVLLLILLQVTGSDWAEGARLAGITAIVIGCLLAVFTGIRSLMGMAAASNPTRRAQYIGSAGGIFLLLIYGGVSLAIQAPLHTLQAGTLERAQQWDAAITEFKLGGASAPTSVSLARVYNEWGEALSKQQRYGDAIEKFDKVLDNYSAAQGEVARAQKGKVANVIALGKQDVQRQQDLDAITQFDLALQLSYCDAACQTQVSELDAAARYHLAEKELAAQHYDKAVVVFHDLTTRFPNSPQARQAHGDQAKALLGKGKQDKNTVCRNAIPSYQELSTTFADTPEGKEAKAALAAPQPVKGHFTSQLPATGQSEVALMQGVPVDISNTQFYQQLAGAPTATIQANGDFTFQPVKQGAYDLFWGNISAAGNREFDAAHIGPTFVYVANVGPLCPFDFGAIGEQVPTAP